MVGAKPEARTQVVRPVIVITAVVCLINSLPTLSQIRSLPQVDEYKQSAVVDVFSWTDPASAFSSILKTVTDVSDGNRVDKKDGDSGENNNKGVFDESKYDEAVYQ